MSEPADPPSPAEQPGSTELVRVLGEIQRRGAIGRGSLGAAIEHAAQFVDALPAPPGLAVDLGSGGGLPALVIAAHAPAWRIVMIERRAKRADLLRYAVQCLGLGERVRVLAEDVAAAARRPELRTCADVVTARSFGRPTTVLAVAAEFLVPHGRVIISEPPGDGDRWTVEDLRRLQFHDAGRVGGVRVLTRATAPDVPRGTFG